MNKCKQKMKKGEGKRKTIKRTMIRRKKRKRRSRRKYILKGGKPIAAGSYGCVFKPSLKYTDCSDQSLLDFRVSKVFIDKTELDKEWNEISSIKTAFETNPKKSLKKVDDYFIYDASKCRIDYSDTSNITQLNEAKRRDCSNIISDDITDYSSNNPYALDSKYGGIDFKKYLHSKGTLDYAEFKRLNSKMIDLFDAIVEMNNANIYHFDIKAENMVYDENEEDENEEKLRLIDFGFAKVFDQPDLISVDLDGPKFPNIVTKLKYNNELIRIKSSGILSYASVFGSYLLDKDWDETLKLSVKEDSDIERDIERYLYSLKIYTDKYYKSARSNYLFTIIKTNLVEIINSKWHVFNSGNSYKQTYFKTVFLHNSDIFAFLMIYLNINVDNATITESIKYLIDKYILTTDYATESYTIEDIRTDLTNLTNLTAHESHENMSPVYASSSGSEKNADFSWTWPLSWFKGPIQPNKKRGNSNREPGREPGRNVRLRLSEGGKQQTMKQKQKQKLKKREILFVPVDSNKALAHNIPQYASRSRSRSRLWSRSSSRSRSRSRLRSRSRSRTRSRTRHGSSPRQGT